MSRVAYSVAASLENGLSAVGSPEVSGLLRTLGHNEPKLFVTLGRLSQDVINLGRERMNLRLIDGRVFDDLVREGYDDFSPEYRTKLFSHSVQIQEYAAVAAWPVAKEPDMPPPVQELHLVAEIQTTHSGTLFAGRMDAGPDCGTRVNRGNAPNSLMPGPVQESVPNFTCCLTPPLHCTQFATSMAPGTISGRSGRQQDTGTRFGALPARASATSCTWSRRPPRTGSST